MAIHAEFLKNLRKHGKYADPLQPILGVALLRMNYPEM
jgi:hypothetical protein